MKISVNWLKEYVDYVDSPPELAERLTLAGLEVEEISEHGADFPNVVVGQILASEPHPNADRLSVCRVDDGSGEPRQIVCGAKNYRVNDKVPVALPGAVLPGDFKIKVGKLRGVESEGMLCSAKELLLADDADGLLILPPDAKVGAEIASLYPADSVFEIEITPNRPDWLSHLGVAREVAALTGSELKRPDVAEVPTANDEALAAIADSEICSLYTVRRISGVKVGASPDWLRTRLVAVGLRPINNVVDVTNYVMFELGQPLHAFDAAKIAGALTARVAVEGETIQALDGAKHELRGGDSVIADATGPVAIAGVIGGEPSSVTESTTEVLLESACFSATRVRRTGRELGISTESSYRFERGVDVGSVLTASSRAATLIAELSGGTLEEPVVVAGDVPIERRVVDLRYNRCRALLGSTIGNDEIDQVLTALGLEKTSRDGAAATWAIPGFRGDLTREVDLIEEVIRLSGIEKLVGTVSGMPAASSTADHDYDDAMELRHRLRGEGFSEARTGTLVAGEEDPDLMRLRNPIGSDQATLRGSMIDALLAAARRNINHGVSSIRMFEIGQVFSTGEEEELGKIAFVMTGPRAQSSWRDGEHRAFDLYDLKGVIEALVPGVAWKASEDPRCGLAVELIVGGFVAGFAGQLSPAAARDLDAKDPVMIAEVRLDCLEVASSRKRMVRAIGKFPAVSRDIAAILPTEIAWAEVESCVRGAREELLESVHLFDVFADPSGEKLDASRKSLAFSLTFRSAERTLTTDEINAVCDRLKLRMRSELPIEIRE
ncbi:MAG: phenylalanine--tRNA ligase subunit beta [Chthoniobacterales bacterium]